jgi:hypothetical protein
MHPGTMLTDAIRQWPSPMSADATRGSDAFARREGNPTLVGAAREWPTPAARDYRTPNSEASQERRNEDSPRGQQLPNYVAHLWATPNLPNGGRMRANDEELVATKGQVDGTKRQVQLDAQARMWPTPTAEPYGSSQNGINGIGGAHERPSANTPSLDRLSRSFLPLLQTSTRGAACSPSAPTSRPRSDETWSTPRAESTVTSRKNLRPFAEGGNTSKPSLQQQATGAILSAGKAKLNPAFVEWLMGLPPAWTGSGPAATAWSRWQQRMRSSLWQLVRASGSGE